MNNPVMSTIVGVILIGLASGLAWAIFFGLEMLCRLVTDETSRATILLIPLILIAGHLLGAGFLENREKTKSRG